MLSGTINAPVAEIMKKPFLDAVGRMAEEPAGSVRRKSFVKSYSFMLSFFAEDPVETWIPELLKWADEEERITFILSVHERLENMDEAQQVDMWQRWLKSYWRHRVNGLPDGLQPRESWHMLRWLPLLQSAFVEAVDVAIRMSPGNMKPDGHSMVFALSESKLPTDYPESVARLLIYLGGCKEYKNWYGGKELVDRLLQRKLPGELVTGLREVVAQLGLQ